MNDFDREIRFEIVEHIGVIKEHSTGWKKEINMVSWNRGAPKIDIRDWNPEHDRMSRGVAFSEEEMKKVIDLMRQRSHPVRSMSRPKDKGYER